MLWATEEIRVKRPRSNQAERLASVSSLEFLVGNFQHIVSDYYWLSSVEYFGRRDAHEAQLSFTWDRFWSGASDLTPIFLSQLTSQALF